MKNARKNSTIKNPVSPAPVRAKEKRLQALENIARSLIARHKQNSPTDGSEMSATFSVNIRSLESDVLCGKRVRAGGRKGNRKVFGGPKERQQLHCKIRDLYVQLKAEHPEWLEKQIDAHIAKQVKRSDRTVQRFKHKAL